MNQDSSNSKSFRNVMRSQSPTQRKRVRALADQVLLEEKAQIVSRGRQAVAHADHLRDVFRHLQQERVRQKLSLGEIARRSGIDKGHLSRLENAPFPNVTLATIERYAEALGKEIRVSITDPQAA